MRFYNLNTSSSITWKSWNKTYVEGLNKDINSIFDYISLFSPDYDILNSGYRQDRLKNVYDFLVNTGLYWTTDKDKQIIFAGKDSPIIDIKNFLASGNVFNTKILDNHQGWIFTSIPEGGVVVREQETQEQPNLIIYPKPGSIFIKTAPEGQYGGYWIPQGNMGLFLPSFANGYLVFNQVIKDEYASSWDFNFDNQNRRYIYGEKINNRNMSLNNKGDRPMIWALTQITENGIIQFNKKAWLGQSLYPLLRRENEEIFTDVTFSITQTYQNSQYIDVYNISIKNVEPKNWKLEVC